jgi:hypothetical protein
MPFYPNPQSFYEVMDDLFKQVLATPSVLEPLRDGEVVLRIVTTDPSAVLIIDGSATPPRFIHGGPAAGRVDIGLRLSADMLHNAWLGKVRLRDAYLTGKIKLESSPLRALSLLTSLTDLFRYVEKLYPQVLRQRGLLS